MRFLQTLAFLFAFLTAAPAAPQELPAAGADPARVSVSGLSSGAYMAVQYSVAHSASVIGAGIVAGGPYDCAAIYNLLFLAVCMQGSPDGATSWAAARTFAAAAVIDPVANLKRQRLYLFSGTNDQVVKPTVMDGLRDFYRAARVPAANVAYVRDVPAGHAFISPDVGDADCGANGGHYIDRCTVSGAPYDQPGAILAQIYRPLRPRAASSLPPPAAFDQGRFAGAAARMAAKGFVYIPAACSAGQQHCAVHVVFHGCGQSALKVGDDVTARLGYNAWAESNGIIILYPQIDPSFPLNLQGCWDWWGYSDPAPQLRGAPQIAAVQAMIDRLEQPRP